LRSLKIFFFCTYFCLAHEANAQHADTTDFEIFKYEDGDSTFIMQKYFLVFLKPGNQRDQSPEEAKAIQAKHLAYLGSLRRRGLICMNGPFGEEGDILGATVYRVSSSADAEKLANADPAVKAGRLEVEVHSWWLAQGTGVH